MTISDFKIFWFSMASITLIFIIISADIYWRKNQIRPIDISPAVAMKFIVSGGVSDIYEEQNNSKTVDE
mgnify:CR=1 FL=1